MSLETFNDHAFLMINAGAHPPSALLDFGLFCAVGIVPLTVALFILLWVRMPDAQRRAALVTATFIMLIGLGINQLIGFFYYHPRPFVLHLGYTWLHHPANNSFPSDHGTFMWSLGFALLALGRRGGLQMWGVLLTLGGFAVAWGRIYVGVHFPLDMIASFCVALGVSLLARPLYGPVSKWALPFFDKIYFRLIDTLHLPEKLFPRA